MGDVNQSRLIAEFCKVTGTDDTRARFFLESAGWDSNLAMSNFFEEDHMSNYFDDANPRSNRITPMELPRPGSPKPPSSRIATIASLLSDIGNNDEEEGQAFYAGGSERSGQQVLGPGKRKAGNAIVDEMFKAVRSFGSEVVDSPEKRRTTKLKAFKGTGHVLGSTSESSDTVSNPVADDKSAENVDINLRLWPTGFTVDAGPLRDYDDPLNQEFLESIRKGEIPLELRPKSRGSEVHLNVEDKSHEEYIPKKPTVQAFAGEGFRLGSITPPVVKSASGEDSVKNANDAQKNVNVDESKPVTSIQIRLADGSRLTMKANHTHTVGDVRRYLVQARPEYSSTVFTLMTSFPAKELTNDSATLEEENVLNAVIVQTLK